MGVFDRIGRIIRANVNSFIEEDPEKILEETVSQMQQELMKMRQSVAGAIATQKRTERETNQVNAQAQEWYRRAQLALHQGDESFAREALRRRKFYQDTAQPLQMQLSQQSEIVEHLKQQLRTLEQKLSEAKRKKEMYIARARSAEASRKLQELSSSRQFGETATIFERMEQKVLELEANTEIMAELSEDPLEKKFAALKEAQDIEAELATLKLNQSQGQNPGKSQFS